MVFVHYLIQLPFYLFDFDNLNYINLLLVYFDHMKINHEVTDYFQEKQFDFPLHQDIMKNVFLYLYTIFFYINHNIY